MEEQPNKKSAVVADETLISNLPDEVLHSVLRLIPCFKEAARTAALSRRWGNLWRSYPVVEFDSGYIREMIKGFPKFSEATIERFSRDKQLGMETLKISLFADKDDLLSLAVAVAVEQLLDLASKRKAEYITIKVTENYVVCLPLGFLTSSTAKTLHFEGIRFVLSKNIDDDPLFCLNSLRSLILDHVDLDGGEQLLTNLIASSPLLETLKLLFVKGISKLSIISNVANLKSLEISYGDDLKEVEIAASGLQTLVIGSTFYHGGDHVLELIAPQLNSLDINYCDISRLGMISKLPFLKSLTLNEPVGDLPLLPRSLRCLSLENLKLTEEQVLLNLIAGSPFLETLYLLKIKYLRKLQVVDLPNLKTLDIIYCSYLEKIKIVAFELQSLSLVGLDYWRSAVSKIELIAPQLNALEIRNSGLKVGDLEVVVSKLLSLKSLSLGGFDPTEKKLKLSGRKLETITLSGLAGLEEIEIDVVPRLKKFKLRYDDEESATGYQLKKCEIKNSAANCQLEVDFHMKLSRAYEGGLSWFVDFKSCIARFPQFHTVNVSFAFETTYADEREEVDYTKRPTAIHHLKFQTWCTFKFSSRDILRNLFWACHPRLLTIDSRFSDDDEEDMFDEFLSHYLQGPDATDYNGKMFNGYVDWRHQLKSVIIITEDANYVVEKAKGLAAIRDFLFRFWVDFEM
ncbi:F-box/FBD/LRR-repeat protein At5g53840, partial [Linum grandiflorum]